MAIYHAFLFTGRSGETRAALPEVGRVLLYGHFAVPVFIVLSGFVLMLPVAARGDLRLRDTRVFLRRRARRILPPYYAALGLFTALILLVPRLRHPAGTEWDSKLPLSAAGVGTHLLLVHNLIPAHAYLIDGPMWSVATEWQLYFLMPFALLPAWRRFGAVPTIAAAVAAGIAVHFIATRLDAAHFWYLGLFAVGMFAAQVVAQHKQTPFLSGATRIVWTVTVVVFVFAPSFVERHLWLSETLLGTAVALSLVRMAQSHLAGRSGPAARVLQSRPLVWLGFFSYSVYLVHSPFLALGNLYWSSRMNSPGQGLLVEMFLVLPAALVLSYAFHRLVERRFMTSHQESIASSAPAAPIQRGLAS